MSKINRTIIVALAIALTPFISYAQSTANSPFSMFGIGDISHTGFGRNQAMGGVASPLVSQNSINPANPASYVALGPNTFIFDFGLKTSYDIIKTPNDESATFNGNIDFVAAGFTINKWWKAGFGLRPLSTIGYEINTEKSLGQDEEDLKYNYTGKGGINSFYIDNSFRPFKFLSVGLKMGYVFGTLDRTRIISFSDTEYSNNYISDENKSLFNSLSYGFGVVFHKSITKNIFLNIGATYNSETSLDGELKRTSINWINLRPDTLFHGPVDEGKLKLPSNYSIGASALFNQKLEVAFDYQVENWQDKTLFSDTDQKFYNNEKICFGLEYVPDYYSTKYFNLIKYRIGFNKTNSYLEIDGKQLKQIGASAGLGLPLKNGSQINFSVLYKKTNIPDNDILEENSFQFNLNLSLRANWFIKKKFY